jgi:hypothetical protein
MAFRRPNFEPRKAVVKPPKIAPSPKIDAAQYKFKFNYVLLI